MPKYDAVWFDPPASLARVNVRHLHTAVTVSDVPMLLDSGADVTLIPQKFVDQLGLPANTGEIYELTGFDGSSSFVSAVRLEMVFLNKTFRGRFLLIEQEWGILGRDILNHVTLLLDGRTLTWQEQSQTGQR